MRVEDLVVEVRDNTLERVAQVMPSELVGSKFLTRYNNVGSWELKIANGSPTAELLRTPGYGLIVTSPRGVEISGPTRSATLEQSADDVNGEWTIKGVDDSVVLVERLAYPTPTTATVTAQTSPYDYRAGNAESVLKGYVNANIGAAAPAVRQANLVVGDNLGRGSFVSGNARFEKLQDLLFGLAQTGGLGYTVLQSGSVLQFEVYQPQDRSTTVRMDLANGKLTKTDYSYVAPSATRAIVAGAGQSQDRVFFEGTTTESVLAETDWARRIEVFVDKRGTSSVDSLNQTAQETLVDTGKTVVSLSVTPSDDTNMRYGYDWGLGDRVTVVVDDIEATAVVTEVGISIDSDGLRIGATVGEPVPLTFESKLAHRSAQQDTRISNLERNTSGVGVSVTYSPVWGGIGLTYTGTPTTGSYTRFGNMIHFRIRVNCTTVTNFGTGQYTLTLPYPPVDDYVFRSGGIHDVSLGAHYDLMADAEPGTVVMNLYSSGAGGSDAIMDYNSPKTLATNDYFYVSGTYEVAI